MPRFALIIKNKTLPGKRDEVRRIWEKHLAPAISANPEHTAYHYCYDQADADTIYAFQQYSNVKAAQAFLRTAAYQAYLQEAKPLLAAPPQIAQLASLWSKGG